MFNRAYVRGVQSALIQSNRLSYPNEKSAGETADYIADRLGELPLMDKEGSAVPVNQNITAKIASYLLDGDREFKKVGCVTSHRAKLASADDFAKLAHAQVVTLMKKAEGSNMEGGDKGNDEPTTAEGKMDEKNRPPGFAEDSLGKTEVDTKPGAVGKESDQPAGPSNTPSGSNSAEEQSRTASFNRMLRKLAEGSNMEGNDKGNQEPTTAEGKMDEKNRPAGYAVLPNAGDLGAMAALSSGSAIIGKEMPNPAGPSNSPSGTNSVIEHTNKAANAEYIELFKKTAKAVMPYLPASLSEDEKIAQIRILLPMSVEKKAEHIFALKTAAATPVAGTPGKTASGKRYDGRQANQRPKAAELGDLLQSMENHDGGDKKKNDGDDDADDKKTCDDKGKEKDASLLDRILSL